MISLSFLGVRLKSIILKLCWFRTFLIVENRIHFERLKVAVIYRIHRLHTVHCSYIWLYERSQSTPHLQSSVQSTFAHSFTTLLNVTPALQKLKAWLMPVAVRATLVPMSDPVRVAIPRKNDKEDSEQVPTLAPTNIKLNRLIFWHAATKPLMLVELIQLLCIYVWISFCGLHLLIRMCLYHKQRQHIAQPRA